MSGTTHPPPVGLALLADRLPAIAHSSRPHTTEEIQYRTARSREDLQGAFALLQRRYQQAGLTADCDRAMRIMPYQLAPNAQVFVATQSGRVIGTVTMVVGPPPSLPLASSYPRVIARLRTAAPILGEISALAIDPVRANRAEVFIQLSKLLTHFARGQELENLVAVVHPRHGRFYQRALGFEVIGEKLPCDRVCGHPGVAVFGPINEPSRVAPAWRPYYFDGRYFTEDLRPRPISKLDRIYFSRSIQQLSPLLHRAA